MKIKDVEKISKALGDPHRLRILQEVKKREWMQCAEICELSDLAQSSVSHHIKQLTDCGLLISEKEGRNMKYKIDKQLFGHYMDFFSGFHE